MKHLVIWIALAFFAQTSARAAVNDTWQKANGFYGQKNYDSAAFYYEQLAAQQPSDAILYYNLGNTYYRLNRVSSAVLNYERALFFEPGLREAKENLALAQSRIPNRIQQADNIFFVNWWNTLTSGSKANGWAIAALFLFLILVAALVTKRSGKLVLPIQTYYIAACIWLVSGFIAYRAAQHAAHSNAAVVMANNMPFMVAPGQVKSQSLIPEGTTVTIESEKGVQTEVSLPDGRRGWMQTDGLERVLQRK